MIVILMVILVVLAVYGVNLLSILKKQNYVLIEMLREQNGWCEEVMGDIAEKALSKTSPSKQKSTEE